MNFEIAETEQRNLTISGNVGIGTTGPQRLLHMNSTSPTFVISESDAGLGLKNRYIAVNGGDMSFGSFSDDFSTSAEHMTILDSGNVGIGTTSPTAKLDVGGSIISGNSSGEFARRIVKVQGRSGVYTKVNVTVNFRGAGGYVYRLQVGGTGTSVYQSGGGYTNTISNWHDDVTAGTGFTASSPASNYVSWVYSASQTHPVVVAEIVGGLNMVFTDDDVTIDIS